MKTENIYHSTGGASTDYTHPVSNSAAKVGDYMNSATSKAKDAVTDTTQTVSNSAAKVGNFMSSMTSKAKNAATGLAEKAASVATGLAEKVTSLDDPNVLGVYPNRATTPKAPTMLQNISPKQKNNNKSTIIGDYTKPSLIDDKEENSDSDDDQITFENIAYVGRKSGEKVFDSGSNLLITQFTLMLDKTIDLITYFGLGYRSLNSVDKKEIINSLQGKRDILMQIAYDPVGQKLVKDMSFALATIISEVIQAAGPPLSIAQQKLTDTIGSGTDKISARIMASIRNMIRIIPVAGDAFIIIENVFKIGQIATELGKTAAKNSQTFVTAFNDVKDKTLFNPVIKEQLDFFSNSTNEFKHLRDKIAGKVGSVIPNNIDDATERFKFGIRDTGKKIAGDFDSASHQIRQQKRDDIRAQGQQQKLGRQKGGKRKKKNKYVFRTRKKCPNVHKVNKHSSRKRKCK